MNYDVFISHASEDKDTLARQLADMLSILNLKVWYDDFAY
ncbi:toll/interleukin-1 receptor domain-containing protein [Clostridium sp. DJ247]|nr:toll/interleukin-1 receptor domain-containing protein [Clostridium sp. DJ247]